MIPPISLCADDVVLFSHPRDSDIEAVREILGLYGRVSGLNVNFAKSSASLIRRNHDDAAPLLAQLGCQLVVLPITDLGISLTL
jgi:hypothetical protein